MYEWVWSIGGMILTGEIWSTGDKSVPVPLVHHKSHMDWSGIEPRYDLWNLKICQPIHRHTSVQLIDCLVQQPVIPVSITLNTPKHLVLCAQVMWHVVTLPTTRHAIQCRYSEAYILIVSVRKSSTILDVRGSMFARGTTATFKRLLDSLKARR
jgi:hypothetical protein